MEELEKNRQYRSNQGRSPEQLETSYKLTFMSMIGFILVLLFTIITNALSAQTLNFSIDGGGGGNGLNVNSSLNFELPITRDFNIGTGVEVRDFESFSGIINSRIHLNDAYSIFGGLKYRKVDVREKTTNEIINQYLKSSGYFTYIEYNMDQGPPYRWRRNKICKCYKKFNPPILYLGVNSYDFDLVNIVAGIRIKLL
jgi:hypothetical protein